METDKTNIKNTTTLSYCSNSQMTYARFLSMFDYKRSSELQKLRDEMVRARVAVNLAFFRHPSSTILERSQIIEEKSKFAELMTNQIMSLMHTQLTSTMQQIVWGKEPCNFPVQGNLMRTCQEKVSPPEQGTEFVVPSYK